MPAFCAPVKVGMASAEVQQRKLLHEMKLGCGAAKTGEAARCCSALF
jgi:hypothetical protein